MMGAVEWALQPSVTVVEEEPPEAVRPGSTSTLSPVADPPPPLGRQRVPPPVQISPVGHAPQVPPQLSEPQILPVHRGVHPPPPFGSGTQLHTLEFVSQISPAEQDPQVPPQPLSPQFFWRQLASQPPWQTPLVQGPEGQFPQIPPHPSSPHCFPVQFGVQTPQIPQAAQTSGQQSELAMHCSSHQQILSDPFSPQYPAHVALPSGPWGMHLPLWQEAPPGQSPQDPPHPLSPHSLPTQLPTQGPSLQKPHSAQASSQQSPVSTHVASHQHPPGATPPQFPAHVGVSGSLGRHWKFLHVVPEGQLPQDPPHPSLPQAFPPHVGEQNEGHIHGLTPDGSGLGTFPAVTQSYHCWLGIHPQPVAHSSQMSVPASQNTLIVGEIEEPLQQPVFSMLPQVPLHSWAQPSAAGRRTSMNARARVLI